MEPGISWVLLVNLPARGAALRRGTEWPAPPHRLCLKVLSGGQAPTSLQAMDHVHQGPLCPGRQAGLSEGGDLNPAPPSGHGPPCSGSPGSRGRGCQAAEWAPGPRPSQPRRVWRQLRPLAPGEGKTLLGGGPLRGGGGPTLLGLPGATHRLPTAKGPWGFPCAPPQPHTGALNPRSSALAWVPAAAAPLGRQAWAPWEGPAARTHLEARPVPAAGAWGHSAPGTAPRPHAPPSDTPGGGRPARRAPPHPAPLVQQLIIKHLRLPRQR